MKHDFIVVGSLNFDIFLAQDRFPTVGETLQAGSAATYPGGKGANQAVQIGRLAEKVTFLGAVGQDIFAAPLRNCLQQNGVDTTLVLEKAGSSGLGVVNHLANGEATATIVAGANFQLQPADVTAVADEIAAASFLLLQNEVPLQVNQQAIELAAQSNTTIIMNAAPGKKIPAATIDKIDVFIVNEVEAAFYLGLVIDTPALAIAQGQAFAQRHQLSMVITMGRQGSVCISGNEACHIPAVSSRVVETTGAGDAFIGALATRLFHQDRLITACRYASCASAIVIRQPGAQQGMADQQQLDRLYRQHYH